MPYYVVLKGARLDPDDRVAYQTFDEARKQAETYCAATDRASHYDVVKVESVWTTQTLGEVLGETK
jgi:hypothetical protein